MPLKKGLEKYNGELGADIKLTDYVCFKLGEGLQKKDEDFAAEVAAQLNK